MISKCIQSDQKDPNFVNNYENFHKCVQNQAYLYIDLTWCVPLADAKMTEMKKFAVFYYVQVEFNKQKKFNFEDRNFSSVLQT